MFEVPHLKTKTVSLLLLLLISLGQTVSAATWYTGDGWGGSVTIEEPATPGVTWYTGDGWGGSCQILAEYSSNWSTYWTMTRSTFDAPTGFTATPPSDSSTSLNLSWSKASNATHTYILGKKGSTPTSRSDPAAFLVCNITGSSHTETSLDIGTHYYFKAWSYNSTLGFSTDNATTDSYTRPGNPTSPTEISNTTTSLTIGFTKGTNATYTIARYSTTGYPTNPTANSSGFNPTANSSGTINSLSSNTTYYISLWSQINPYSPSYTTINATTPAVNTSSTIDPPYNGANTYNTSTSDLTLTWTSGNHSSQEVVIRSATGYPANPADGTEVYRNNTNTYTENNIQSTYYYTVFSYNTTQAAYSTTGLQIPWGGLRLQVYNESQPSQSLTFDLEITTNDGSTTYTSTDNTGYVVLDIDEIPYGDDTIIRIASEGYKTRTYVKDLDIGAFYNYTFYLPPAVTYNNGSSDPPPGWTPTLRSGSNSANCLNPDVDLDINLSHTPDSIISVQRYQSVYSRLLKTDSSPVTDTGSNATITLTKTLDETIGVYVYNSSLYGGWTLIPDSNYTLNNTHVEVSSDRFDSNSTIIKIDYYYQAISYYTWETLSENAYSLSGTNLTIDKDSLDSNTSICKADYYYYDMGGYSEPIMCLLKVVDSIQQPISTAKVVVKRYINTTDGYEEIASDLTDGNGQMSLYLLPDTLYLFDISKGGYTQLGSKYWTPTNDLYQKIFALNENSSEFANDTTYNEIIDFDVAWNTNGTFTITYTDSSNGINTANLVVYSNYTNKGLSAPCYWYNSTSASGFTHITTDTFNTSYDYLVSVTIDHDLFIYYSDSRMMDRTDPEPPTNNSEFNLKFDIFGDSTFGWSSLFGFFVLLVCVFSFGPRNAGFGLMVSGAAILFFQSWIGLNLLDSAVATLFIIVGGLVQWRVIAKERMRG